MEGFDTASLAWSIFFENVGTSTDLSTLGSTGFIIFSLLSPRWGELEVLGGELDFFFLLAVCRPVATASPTLPMSPRISSFCFESTLTIRASGL
jgi:hypothetical protein